MVTSYRERGKLGAIASKDAIERIVKDRRAAYEDNPKHCKECAVPIPYEKKGSSQFCNRTCSAKYNNRKRTSRAAQKICPNCTSIFTGMSKYCSNECYQLTRLSRREENVLTGNATPRTIRAYLISVHGEQCSLCSWNLINPVTQNCPVELDHIDGDSTNNELSNLRLLCPNCHSLTPTYKALNKGNGRHSRMDRYNAGKSY